jgi:hypothetical protein
MGIMNEQTRLLNNKQVYMQIAAKQIVVTVTAYSNFSPFVRLSEYRITFWFFVSIIHHSSHMYVASNYV